MAGIILEIAVDDKGSIVVKKFADKTKEAFDQMKKGPEAAKGPLESLSQSWIGFTAKIGIATAALYGADRAMREMASAGNDIERMSRVFNMSTDDLQKWSYITKMADIDMQGFGESFKYLTRSMSETLQGSGDAARAFDKLGINIKDTTGKTKDQQTVMMEIIGSLEKYSDGVNRDALMLAIFGRGWMSIKPLVDQGTRAIEENRKEAERLNAILGKDTVRALSESEDAFKRWDAVWKVSKAETFSPMITIFTSMLERILALKNAFKEGGFKGVIQDILAAQEEERINVQSAAEWTKGWVAGWQPPKKGEAPAIMDIKKYFEEQKPYYESLSKQAEQIERMAYGGMENKAFFEQLEATKKIEENLKEVEGERARVLAEDMFPAQEKVNQMVDQGNKYWAEQNRILSETKDAIDQMDWEDVASGVRTLSSETERSNNVTKIATEKLIDKWNKTKDVFASIGDNISSVWATNMSKMITDAKNWKDALDNIWKGMADAFISALLKMGTNWVLFGQTKGSEGWSGTTGGLGNINTLGKSLRLWGGTTPTASYIAPVSEWESMTWLQHGGVINKPSVIGVGEAGPEAVIPLKGGKIPIEGSKGDTYNTYGPTYIEATDVGSFERKYGPVVEYIYARGKRFRKVPMRE